MSPRVGEIVPGLSRFTRPRLRVIRVEHRDDYAPGCVGVLAREVDGGRNFVSWVQDHLGCQRGGATRGPIARSFGCAERDGLVDDAAAMPGGI